MGYIDGCQGIEISSPITPFTGIGIRRLTDAVSLLRREARFILDPSCSVHCHVGNAENRWTHLDVKKILTLVWFCEPLILSVIHPLRREGHYSKPITTDASMTNPCTEDLQRPKDLIQYVPLGILPAKEANSLTHLWNGDEASSFGQSLLHKTWGVKTAMGTNFQDISRSEVSGTFEFRYLQGCMENELLVQYIRFCVAIVHFAHTSRRAKYHSLLEKLIRDRWEIGDPNSSVVSMLLAELGVLDSRSFWVSQAAKMAEAYDAMEDLPSWCQPGELASMIRTHQGIDINFNVFGQFVYAESREESSALDALLKTMFQPK